MLADAPFEKTIFLASKSPRRKEILQNAGFSVSVISSTCEEPPHPRSIATSEELEIVTKIAEVKCNGGVPNIPESFQENSVLIMGADTLVFCGNLVMGKPRDRAHAEEMMKLLSGKEHSVATGVSLKQVCGGRVINEIQKTVVSTVEFRTLNQGEIDWYLDQNEYQDKAGAYGIQGKADAFVDSINGSFSNIVGLPLSHTLLMIQALSKKNWHWFID